jgi:hypothetical protein
MNRKGRPAFDRSISDAVKRRGRAIMMVAPSGHCDCCGQHFVEHGDGGFGFMYTIGNAARGLPELLVVGAYSPGVGSLLNALCDKLIERGCAFADGEEISLGGKFPVKAVNADERAQRHYTCGATGRFGAGNYAVQQVLLCDPEGRYPGDPDCCAPYNAVPVLRASVH